jgi:hypothetical protein
VVAIRFAPEVPLSGVCAVDERRPRLGAVLALLCWWATVAPRFVCDLVFRRLARSWLIGLPHSTKPSLVTVSTVMPRQPAARLMPARDPRGTLPLPQRVANRPACPDVGQERDNISIGRAPFPLTQGIELRLGQRFEGLDPYRHHPVPRCPHERVKATSGSVSYQ